MDAATYSGLEPPRKSRNQVVRRLILAFVGLLGLALLIGLLAFLRIAQGLDEREAAQSRFHAESALAQLQKNERTFLLTHAFWQAAYDHLSGTVDTRWAYDEDNIGASLYSDDGYQGVFVLDDEGTHYAMVDGQLTEQPLAHYSANSGRIVELAHKAGQQDQASSGYMLFAGQPSLFTAAVIRAPSQPHHLPGSRAVLVFVRVLDASLLESLGRSAGLSGFATSASPPTGDGQGMLALEGSGHVLTWHIEAPGTQLLRTVLPPLVLGVLLMLVFVALIARQAMRTSGEIDRSHQQLALSRSALQISEERFKAVAEAASDWIWETDADLRLSYLSDRFSELTGLQVTAWLGQPVTELLDCDTGKIEHWLQGLAATAATGSLRCQYHDHLGQQRICRLSARAILRDGRCHGYRGTSSDITDEVAAHAQIQHLSLHDALTGLPNRNKLFRYLESSENAKALLMLDLDNFKPINDSLGHPAGDAVLIEVAGRLGRITRDCDLVARLGGDEFIVVLARPGKQPEVDRFCARLVQALEQPMLVEGHTVRIGVSVGVVLASDYPGPASDLIRYADVALLSAKQAGKHTWRYFSAQLNAAVLEKRTLERELREGIDRGELVLHFQPRYSVDGVQVASVEALVRWQHPQYGLMRPDQFIGLAEESDLIVLLGNQVLLDACTSARHWPLAVTVSVNMSPAQFSRSDVVRDVADALRASGLPAHRLELEITEGVMLNDVEGALHTMNALKELGVRLNMDDFGTGYSSLGYLRTYPFDSIKIDKRFIQSLGRSASDRSVVQAIINLGNAMGMTVTAEGVETAEQLALLSDDQCHEVQGFLLSHPLEEGALVLLMREQMAMLP